MATNLHVGLKLSLILYIILLHCCSILQQGEAAANSTDPQEVEALKIIAKKLGNTAWNFKEEPCSGKGSWNVSQNKDYENRIACNCTLDGRKNCHVTQILLKSQDLAGVVPPELANLTYLETLDLTRNYLNGSIPAELGSLVHLKNLSLGINRLSGHIPKEIGNLSSLESLTVPANNLSGILPQELGKLSKLQRLHIGNNQFTGRIPKSLFYGLKALKDFRASSNNFKGKIPDLIGNWKNISSLKLQATSLEGPIPSNISGLINLTDLRISDLTRGGSNLSFVRNLKKLKTLVLRNALIYGEIPSSLGKLKKLEILDLSFNNLTGSIPETFQIQTTRGYDLEYLYLGNNGLSGEPQLWLSKINNVDLSYNNFSGDFPSNFTNHIKLDEARLQRRLRCDKGDQQYILAINCGGEQWTNSTSSISYDADENSLGASSISIRKKWAVSSTGHFMDNKTQTYIKKANNSQFTTDDTILYRTARSSPTSLRYHGLCLYNGSYKVQLHFAEIVFSNDKSFRSFGKRIFDVYIQGVRVLQDFNIMENAQGAEKVVVTSFTVNVTNNYLEIHFLWTGKGTYNVPDEGSYGPLVSAITVTYVHNKSNGNKAMIIGIVLGVVISLSLAVCLSFIFIKKRNRIKNRFLEAHADRELTNMKTISNYFSLEEIRIATGDFHSENKLGEGGFGAVFKGILSDGKMVAVKQMFSKSRQGNREFLNEVGTISAVQHPNLVKLYGCCIEGKQLLLVYEYLENNSLARALFGPQEFRLNLNWPARYNICLGVARGLAYLHEESRLRIVHRDIKSTNILLDQNLNSKIADFGLAKLFDQDQTHVSTRVAGTIGYMAPEYALKGQLTEKADVYSFGVVVLEVVSGRANTDKKLQGEMVYLLEWTWHLNEENRLLDLVDANLKGSSFFEEDVLRTINVGLLCTHATPNLRPSMSTVVSMLEGRIEAHVSHCKPPYLSYRQSHVLAEEKPLSCSRSLSLEGPWKGSFSSQASSAAKQQQNEDNDENSLILHDLYPVSIHDHTSS